MLKRHDELKKRAVCIVISKEDLFDLDLIESDLSLWKQLLNQKTKTPFLSLINEITGDFLGRKYISRNYDFINQLAGLFIEEQPDSKSHQNLIGIFQKLSLIPEVQKLIIQKQLIQQSFNLLNTQFETISEYLLEYLLALIINLSMNKEMRKIYEKDVDLSYIKTLMKYWTCCPVDIRKYLNGAIYSLVSNPKTKIRAQKFDLESKLSVEYHTFSDNNKKQVDYIIEKIKSDEINDTISSYYESKDLDNLNLEIIGFICRSEQTKLIKDNDIFRTYQLDENESKSKSQLEEILRHFEFFFESHNNDQTNFNITDVGGLKDLDDSAISYRYSHIRKPFTHLMQNDKTSVFAFSPISGMNNDSKNYILKERDISEILEKNEVGKNLGENIQEFDENEAFLPSMKVHRTPVLKS